MAYRTFLRISSEFNSIFLNIFFRYTFSTNISESPMFLNYNIKKLVNVLRNCIFFFIFLKSVEILISKLL